MTSHRISIPPLSQPLHHHFQASKRHSIIKGPKSDADSNPFLAQVASSSSSTKDSLLSSHADKGDYIHPTRDHGLKGSRKLPLAEYHSTLLSLHSAVEHALIVHLATSGGNAVDSTSLATSTIQLPCVITFNTLRPIVERSCGRRFGSNELAKLMWLWGSAKASMKEDVVESSSGCNIGFHVTRAKTMDRFGKKSYDYFFSLQVGIDLNIDEEEQEDGKLRAEERRKRRISSDGQMLMMPTTPPRKRVRPLDLPEEPQTPSPSPRSISTFTKHPNLLTPPASPSFNSSPHRSPTIVLRSTSISANGSPSIASVEGRSSALGLVAMWNSGIDGRKREVRRRLVNWTLACYETWKRQTTSAIETRALLNEMTRPSTPPTSSQRAVEGQGGMLTPSATREEGWIPGRKRVKDMFANRAEEVNLSINDTSLIQEWDPAFPLDKVAPTPEAILPEAPIVLQQKKASASVQSQSVANRKQRTSKTVEQAETTMGTTPDFKLSLTERIKAKQDAKRHQMQSRASIGLGLSNIRAESNDDNGTAAGTLNQSRSAMMDNLKRRSALSRLQDIAESMYMLFSSKATAAAATQQEANNSGTSKRYPLLPINEVAKSICTSSKVSMSELEARQSMRLLQELAPGFVEINKVGAREWVRVGMTLEGEQIRPQNGGLLGAVRRRIRAEMDKT